MNLCAAICLGIIKKMNASANGDIALKERIRNARSKFAAMAGTYFVGVFNDNFFKQTALFWP